MPDHLHMLIGFRPDENMSQLIQVVKSESTKWINDNNFNAQKKFGWQDSFGAFSYSKSHVPGVIRYIQNRTYHRKQTFLEEYVAF